MKVGLGADHAGYALKAALAAHLIRSGHEIVDFGTDDAGRSVDYPVFAQSVAEAVVLGTVDLGVLVCGTGIGMSIAANKVHGARCALVHDVTTAQLARRHNDANILAFGGRFLAPAFACEILDAFFAAEFEPRHAFRLNLIGVIERQYGGSR